MLALPPWRGVSPSHGEYWMRPWELKTWNTCPWWCIVYLNLKLKHTIKKIKRVFRHARRNLAKRFFFSYFLQKVSKFSFKVFKYLFWYTPELCLFSQNSDLSIRMIDNLLIKSSFVQTRKFIACGKWKSTFFLQLNVIICWIQGYLNDKLLKSNTPLDCHQIGWSFFIWNYPTRSGV